MKDLEKAARLLKELLDEEYARKDVDAELSLQSKRLIEEKLSLVMNRIAHLKLHLSAKTKFQAIAYEQYIKADQLLCKARECDESSAFSDAVRYYESAYLHFRQSLHGIPLFLCNDHHHHYMTIKMVC